MLVVFVAVLVATGYLYVKVPKGFIPEADNDSIYVNSEAAQGTSFYKMFEYQTDGRGRVDQGSEHRQLHVQRRQQQLGIERIEPEPHVSCN